MYPSNSQSFKSNTLLHERPLRVCWLTASNAAVDFGGCDDEHSQAHRRLGVRLSNPAGGCAGCHREGSCWVGLLLHRTRRKPGMWVGSGLAGIDGLQAWAAVTVEQMRALFGAGMHPLATQRLQQLSDADLTDANIEAATRLGSPFKVSEIKPSRFRVEVAKRIAAARSPGSCSRPSMAGHQQMPARWPGRSRSIPGRGRRQSPALI